MLLVGEDDRAEVVSGRDELASAVRVCKGPLRPLVSSTSFDDEAKYKEVASVACEREEARSE